MVHLVFFVCNFYFVIDYVSSCSESLESQLLVSIGNSMLALVKQSVSIRKISVPISHQVKISHLVPSWFSLSNKNYLV